MKRFLSFVVALALSAALFGGCGDSGVKDSITVLSREEGSGTRSAFVELMDVTDGEGNDAITALAEVTNSTAVMLSSVSGNKNAIGYVSLGSLSSEVKAVTIDGVTASAENIRNGSYSIARPFNLVWKDGALADTDQDFLRFILSNEGQRIIAEHGYIAEAEGEDYTAAGLGGTVTLAGSTSVAPVMERLADRYKELNPNVNIEIQQSGSSAGITSAMEGVCAFGMSSRELKEEEAAALKCQTIATDGIAVIVNKENAVRGLSAEQVKQIFLGEITAWSALA